MIKANFTAQPALLDSHALFTVQLHHAHFSYLTQNSDVMFSDVRVDL